MRTKEVNFKVSYPAPCSINTVKVSILHKIRVELPGALFTDRHYGRARYHALVETSGNYGLGIDQSIFEFEGEGSFEAHVESLLEAVPKGSTLRGVLRGPDYEGIIPPLFCPDVTDRGETLHCGEVVEIELEGAQL